MSRQACKIIIDGVVASTSDSIKNILTDYNIHQGLIPEKDRLEMIEKFIEIDHAYYEGGEVPYGGLAGLLVRLEKYDLVSPHVWKILVRPGSVSNVYKAIQNKDGSFGLGTEKESK